MGLKTRNSVGVVFGSLRANAYRAKAGIEDEMEKAAQAVAKTAADMAPRDTGALEKSIQVVTKHAGNQLRFAVRVNPSATRIPRARDGKFKRGRRDLVTRYAMFMEEGDYNLGPGSRRKNESMLGSGKTVGPHFFRRAKAMEWPKFQRQVAAKLARQKYKYRWRFGR